jgi:threonine synthase|tara:strand:+ start:159 stop:416 length:258 start_codon:yes stop_codon:yes gene_type:complete
MYAITNAALTQKAAIGGRAVRLNRQKAAVRRFAAVAPVRAKLYDNILETIGNTPIVKISDRLAPKGVEVYAKAEFMNPCSSVKDR